MSNIIIVSILIGVGGIIIAYILTHNKGYPRRLGENRGERESQYECGIELMEEEYGESIRKKEYIKYYIIGIIFLIFDLESIILYPGVYNLTNELTNNKEMEGIGKLYIVIIGIISIIIVGWIYEYRKKVL